VDSDVYLTDIQNSYPENTSQGKDRSTKMIDSLLNKYDKSEKKVAHIIITHSVFVHYFSSHFGKGQKRVEYCAVSGIKIQDGHSKFIMDAETYHCH
jgi:predicted Zn-dependent protease with MMP-like domain